MRHAMSTQNKNLFGAQAKLHSLAGDVTIFRLNRLSESGIGHLDQLPYSIKVLLESCLRNTDNFEVMEDDVRKLAAWNAKSTVDEELPFKPARVILQDFTGVPAVVDLAAMRSAMKLVSSSGMRNTSSSRPRSRICKERLASSSMTRSANHLMSTIIALRLTTLRS